MRGKRVGDLGMTLGALGIIDISIGDQIRLEGGQQQNEGQEHESSLSVTAANTPRI